MTQTFYVVELEPGRYYRTGRRTTDRVNLADLFSSLEVPREVVQEQGGEIRTVTLTVGDVVR